MPESDLDLLERITKEAGEIALKYFKADPKVWDKDDNAGPVTEADLAVDRHLKTELRKARPDYGWLSEETEDSGERLSQKRVFIVDPIDGTRAFIDGVRNWALSVAVVEHGQPIAAVVLMPAKQTIYAAALGQGANKNGDPIQIAQNKPIEQSEILAAKPALTPNIWKNGRRPPFKISFRSSLAYRLCAVAEGRFDGMITLRPTWEWDIAAGSLIAAEAGAGVTDANGNTLRFNNRTPQVSGVVMGLPNIVNSLHNHLS